MYNPESDVSLSQFEDVETFFSDNQHHRRMENVELAPRIEPYFVDGCGNAKKSKEFVKRRLTFAHKTIEISIEIA